MEDWVGTSGRLAPSNPEHPVKREIIDKKPKERVAVK
jgi:hypothetical protein